MKVWKYILIAALVMFTAAGCQASLSASDPDPSKPMSSAVSAPSSASSAPEEPPPTVMPVPAAEPVPSPETAPSEQSSQEEPASLVEAAPLEQPSQEEPAPSPVPSTSDSQGISAMPAPSAVPDPAESAGPAPVSGQKLVVIDAGHQKKRNGDKEPVGPGSSEMKAKVSSGTQGRFSRVPEYQVNLDVALQLRDELENRGYEVIMIRETNDIDISNVERAAVANEAKADAFIRIHCNGSENPEVHGSLTICPTKKNPYSAGKIYESCRALSDCVLAGVVEAAGTHNRGVWETDTMSGINWCEVPVTIIEMGYMTNEAEDWNLVDPAFQAKLVSGIANGLDVFFVI